MAQIFGPRDTDRAGPSVNSALNASTITVVLVQINNSFSGQNYLPYSVGCLQAYVQRPPDPVAFHFLPPLYKRVRIADAVSG